jgi:hypothetical protein
MGSRLPDGRTVATVDDIWVAGYTEDDAIPITEERPAEPPGVLPLLPGDPARDGDLCIIGGRRYQIVPADSILLYEQIRALVRPHHITPQVLQHGAIYGGWATRARFASG